MIGRREFITLLGGAVAAWPLTARAQQPAMPVIGYLSSDSREGRPELFAAFLRGLAEIGYVEGHNVAIDSRWADGRYDRQPALAADLVRHQVGVISAVGTQSALVAKAATQTIPIVFTVGADPVQIGLVASLNRPGGNLTGVSVLSAEIAAKRLELLRELLPAAALVALLVNPANPVLAEAQTKELQVAARVLGVRLLILNAGSPSEIDAAFATLVLERAGALLVSDDPVLNAQRVQLAVLAARHAVPTIYQFRESTVAGGLMSYGGSLTDAYRLVGAYTGRILKGEKVADLPVQQATKVELIINLRTAKALGLTVPLTLLNRADEVIE
jgi:putative ABC transport system substrate-binding protein